MSTALKPALPAILVPIVLSVRLVGILDAIQGALDIANDELCEMADDITWGEQACAMAAAIERRITAVATVADLKALRDAAELHIGSVK